MYASVVVHSPRRALSGMRPSSVCRARSIEFWGGEKQIMEPSNLTGCQDGETTCAGWALDFDFCRVPLRRACPVEGNSSPNGSGAENDVRVVDVQIPPEGDLPGGSPN